MSDERLLRELMELERRLAAVEAQLARLPVRWGK